MNKENKRLLNAVIITISACLAIFALAITLYGKDGIWKTDISMVNTRNNTGVIIPIEIGEPDVITGSTSNATPEVIATGITTNSGSIICTREYMPVCGSDKQTYPNACLAKNQGVTVFSEGECKASANELKPIMVVSGEVNNTKPTTVCTMEYAPICGVDNKTYSNSCVAGDVSILHIGPCDGTEKPQYDANSYHLYANSGLNYAFAMPKYSYYSGAGARDGALHTMSISTTASGILDFNTATVQVWFYKTEPANPPSSQYKKIDNGIIYIKNNDTTGNAKVQKIITTVLDSVE